MNRPSAPTERLAGADRAVEALRIGMGMIWALNLLFIILPSAEYWSSFSSVASGFGSSTPGGPGFAGYVAHHPAFFSWAIAVATAYLAVAFLLGFTTRLACVVGVAASVIFLWTQYTSTFAFPGGTDVGAHPLYIAMYVALLLGGAGRYWSLDRRVWRMGSPWLKKVGRWVAGPPA